MCRNNNKAIIASVLICAVGFLAFFSKNREEGVWGVVGEIPPAINIENGIDSSTYYIIRQTHEPLFRCDDLQNYTSRVLKSWSRSVDSKKFIFSPDTSLMFNKTARLTEDLFFSYISSTTARYGGEFRLSRSSGCVEVEFAEPQKKYLYFLTWYENSPVVRDGNVEHGLGAFYITTYGRDQIVFDRKRHVGNGYNAIRFYRYQAGKDWDPQANKIQDFNLLSPFQQPDWVKADYVGIKNPDPRTIVLLINHPNAKVRKKLYNCLDVSQFRKAFVPKRKEFYDVKTVLPVGIPGAKSGLPEQVCGKEKVRDGGKVVLINQMDGNQEPLGAYLKVLRSRTGIGIVQNSTAYRELIEQIKGPGRKPFSYNLLVMILDTFRPDHKVFFEYTSGSKSFLDVHPPEVETLFQKLLGAEELDAQSEIAEELAGKLAKEALVLPLYQTYSVIYYPRNIKNMVVGRSFTQYPEVADFRW